MRKPKRFRLRRRAFTFFRRKRRNPASSPSLMGTILGGMLYGGIRARVSNALTPITSKLPFGDLTDEVAMGVLSYALAKGKIPILNKWDLTKKIGVGGLIVESARVGEYTLGKIQPPLSPSNNLGGITIL